MTSERRAIPWVFVDSPLLKAWTWTTPHFESKILSMGAKDSYTWKVVDKTGSPSTVIGAGEFNSFTGAEEELLELIGKAYPISLGYQAYAGDLATTFVIRSGKKVDLSAYLGGNVIVDVFDKKNPEFPLTIVGLFSLSNYKVHIKTDRNSISVIPPEFIINIRREFDPSQMKEKVESFGSRRVFNTEWVQGCTGHPGFVVGTVIHNPSDEFCSIHDI